jgi:hypothetical protein
MRDVGMISVAIMIFFMLLMMTIIGYHVNGLAVKITEAYQADLCRVERNLAKRTGKRVSRKCLLPVKQ